MNISHLEESKDIEIVNRFNNMIDRIQSTEARIMARAREIELGSDYIELSRSRSYMQPADLPELFLAERMIGGTNDILSIEFLEAGLAAKRPVGRILDGMGSFATGFLIGKGLLMTAAHALPSVAAASIHEFQLDFESHAIGAPVISPRYSLDPDRFFFANEEFDVAVVAVTDFTGMYPPLDTYGWFVLNDQDETILAPEPVSIIQHPRGREKSIVVHNSRFVHCDNTSEDERYCWYTGDTERGSSGAPVFDPQWNILALHHRAIPSTNKAGEILDKSGQPILQSKKRAKTLDDLHDLTNVAFVANQGVRQSRIFRMLERSVLTNPAHEATRVELLTFWRKPGAKARARTAAQKGAI